MRAPARLARLEHEAGLNEPVDKLVVYSTGMCNISELQSSIQRVARDRARRRALLEGRLPPTGCDPPDLDDLMDTEFDELERLLDESGDLHGSVERWCNEPDEAGWPRERSSSRKEHGYAAFQADLARGRQVLDHWRSGQRAARWRAANPEWRPGMTDEEFYAWDLERWVRRARENDDP
jgi:hypothetical protein